MGTIRRPSHPRISRFCSVMACVFAACILTFYLSCSILESVNRLFNFTQGFFVDGLASISQAKAIISYTDSFVLGSWLAGWIARRLWRLRPNTAKHEILLFPGRWIGKRRWRRSRRFDQLLKRFCKNREKSRSEVFRTASFFFEIIIAGVTVLVRRLIDASALDDIHFTHFFEKWPLMDLSWLVYISSFLASTLILRCIYRTLSAVAANNKRWEVGGGGKTNPTKIQYQEIESRH